MSNGVYDAAMIPRHPFGLPLGSVRAFMSLLICGFFWMILLWPDSTTAKPLLGHFFLLAMVLMAFSSAPTVQAVGDSALLPWVLRIIFVGGSVAVVGYTLFKDPALFSARMTPDVAEFRDWWGPLMAITAAGFAAGLLMRVILGRHNVVFQTLRSWLGLIGMIMLVLEFALFMMFVSTEPGKTDGFMHIWQAVEVGVVASYFGSRT